MAGQVSPVKLAEFDAHYSAVVSRLCRRKPILKEEGAVPDSACVAPVWQRGPVGVSFEAAGRAKQTFAIRGHVVDLGNDPEEEEGNYIADFRLLIEEKTVEH